MSDEAVRLYPLPTQRDKRLGELNRVVRLLYSARGNEAAMRANAKLTAALDADRRTWENLVAQLGGSV
jgi:hypothetical protein